MAEIKDSMSGSDQRSSREIRDDIRRTRAAMDETVGAIEQKLSPGELVHEAWGLFRGGSSSSVNRLWRIAKQHPMPSVIIGLGLGWMAYESAGGNEVDTQRSRFGGRYSPDERWSSDGEIPTALETAKRRAGGAVHRATDAAGSAIDKAGDLADDVGDMASDVAGSVRRAAESAGDTANDLVGQARHVAGDVSQSVRQQAAELGRQASELGGQAHQGVQQARVGFWETLEEQPLVVGVATLAAGLLVGLLVPSTPREDDLMGKARDSLLDQIKGLGQEALEKGRQVASAAVDTVKQAAETQGISADRVADTLRSVGRGVVETVKTEAEKQNLTTEASPSGEFGGASRQDSPQPPKHRAA